MLFRKKTKGAVFHVLAPPKFGLAHVVQGAAWISRVDDRFYIYARYTQKYLVD
jgi:hypothetical protein